MRGDFFKNKLLLLLDVVFDSESNGRYFSSLAEKNIFFSCHQEALESWNNDHSTQNRKLHQAIVTVCFRKNHPSQFVFILPLEVCQKKKFGTYKENLRNSPFFSAEHIFACTQRRLGAKLSSLLSTRGWVWPWRASKRKTQILSPIWDHCELLTVFFN